ncbi:MAG TPA: DUF624 domain-containing protein [Candidatus Binatia bacterium]|nr:DUF624 domain-containing protein [Candidatus Binatia bacterium]
MQSLAKILSRALRLWWQEVVVLLVLNAAWFLLQIPVLTGPPATAMLYAMVRRSMDGEYWNLRDAWRAFRELFWSAWRWGLANALVWIVGIWNLAVYWRASGAIWFALRLLWIGALAVWLALNFFYWPFWLAQEDRSLLNTYRNCARFLLLHAGLAFMLVVFSVVLTVLSLVTTLPFTLALTCWLALLGLAAVQHSLAIQANKPT